MISIRKILFPTDFSDCSKSALRLAVKLAKENRAELHVMHAIVLLEDDPHDPAHHLPDPYQIRRILEELATKRMGTLVKDHDIPDLVVTRVHRRGISPAPPIVEYAEEADIDLIVMGTHGRRGVRKLLLGSVAAEVTRMAPCSVLTVPSRDDSGPAPDFRRILVPVDFSDPSIHALKVACGLANDLGSRLYLAYVLGEILHPAFYNMGARRLSDFQPEALHWAKSALKEAAENTGNCGRIRMDYFALEGHAAREIVRFIRNHPTELIVMGSHGRTGIKQVLLGGTTEKVISGAECPVLVVKESGKPLLS
jgi:nucleotide-binding universal stress UspA family protein